MQVHLRKKKPQANKQTNKHTHKQKQTNNDLQNITQKPKDRSTGTPLKTGVNSEFVLLVYNYFKYLTSLKRRMIYLSFDTKFTLRKL